jgi:carbohydrate-binding DOMON domain-containing protein
MSTQYRLVQSGKTASGGCSAGQGSSEPVAPRIYSFYLCGDCENMSVTSHPNLLDNEINNLLTVR